MTTTTEASAFALFLSDFVTAELAVWAADREGLCLSPPSPAAVAGILRDVAEACESLARRYDLQCPAGGEHTPGMAEDDRGRSWECCAECGAMVPAWVRAERADAVDGSDLF